MSANSVDEARQLLEARARELRDELGRVERAIRSLGDASSATSPSRANSHRRRGRRADQALELIAKHPGITITELASQMGLKGPHYLYRVLPRLEGEKLISKKGDGYRLAKR
jgi:hypothetical protein